MHLVYPTPQLLRSRFQPPPLQKNEFEKNSSKLRSGGVPSATCDTWSAKAPFIVAAVAASLSYFAPFPANAFEVGSLMETGEVQAWRELLPSWLPGYSRPAPEPSNPLQNLLSSDPAKAAADREQMQKEKEKEKEKMQKERERKQREREEKERQAKIKREQERIKRERDRLFRQQAILGGSAIGLGALFIGKWQAVAAGAAILFRTLGGPTIMSGILRSPGLLFGRSLRVVEWDVAKSPRLPDGRVVSFKLRALTPVGLRQAIVRNCGLSDGREVKQICHWIQSGPGFCEPLTSVPAFRMLPDPSWIVWSRKPRKGLDAIPYRLDEAELAVQEQAAFSALSPQQELELLLRTINAAAVMSRGEAGRTQEAPPAEESHSPEASRHHGRNGRNIGSNGSVLQEALERATSSGDARTSTEGSLASEEVEKLTNQAAIEKLREVQGSNGQECADSSSEGSSGPSQHDKWQDGQPKEGRGTRLTPSSSRSSSKQAATSIGNPSWPPRMRLLSRPVELFARRLADAAADPVAATRDAFGVPPRECQPSPVDIYRGNVPGPSTGGQGAEFRESSAQLGRFKVAADSMEEALEQMKSRLQRNPIGLTEEADLVATAVATDGEGLMRLFRTYAADDMENFLRFARAYAQRQHSSRL